MHFQSDQRVKIAPIHIWRNFKVPNYWLNDTNERKNEKNGRKKQPIHRNGEKVCVQYVSLFAYRLYLIQGVVVMYLYLHEKHKRVFTCKWLWELCVYVMPSISFIDTAIIFCSHIFVWLEIIIEFVREWRLTFLANKRDKQKSSRCVKFIGSWLDWMLEQKQSSILIWFFKNLSSSLNSI